MELHWPYETPAGAVAERCAARGVALLGINTAVGSRAGDAGLAAVPGREAEAREAIDQAFEYAAAAGGTAVHVMAGKVAPSAGRETGGDVFTKALRYVAERAEESRAFGVAGAAGSARYAGLFLSYRLEEAVGLIDVVGSARIRLMFDCYHVGATQGDVITRLRLYQKWIGHIQVAAVPSRAEPDEGELAYRAIFAEIDALGYDGWVGCEYKPRAGTDAGMGWTEALGVTL